MTAEQFLNRANLAYISHVFNDGEQRHGQFLFNMLYQWHPVLANAIRGGGHDPYYQNSRIDKFSNFVTYAWNAYER